MLFPPPGVKIRRTIETLWLPNTPTMIAGYDPRRVLVSVLPDYSHNVTVAFAGNLVGLDTQACGYGGYGNTYEFWGGEELWAQWVGGNGVNGDPILVQSVFYD